MKLYIIGNGFDLAHNIPTKYWDFMTYVILKNILRKHLRSHKLCQIM